ncbi:MAG: class I SAM-dependent methyltransferase [Anaerolineae bacterium]|jgi:SAM-dependent methyltransferase|nr:class I SAM-dependent methyltransferase [Anaerolineae bacterium]MBT3712328.1 class I SAM-dependent methyltransferase [Anaerolineae bacterium]MBT4310523.1 class I SAM-dependent methyltransferase [Anaerolineae bacterium]MBT4458953.1 class I SAM-dependent methyltransferase [Anaerolineae bacterium]MBT4842468.1 class I SAM-dependent methyltransferase [Anaerolineae bacterium]
MAISKKEHWDKIYTDGSATQLGWYEPKSFPSSALIERCAVPKHSPIVDLGSGRSTLISHLIESNYQNVYAVDISNVALKKAKEFLGQEQATQVNWIVDDITNPDAVLGLQNVALWHDRAVFHFLTDEDDRQKYRSVLKELLMLDGFLVMATFALDGASKCSGLPVQRYSAESLSDFLGDRFKLVESLEYSYQMPSGNFRPFVYTRFQKA